MKLRMRHNSLRFRLQVSEVQSLLEYGKIEEKVSFGPSCFLSYVVELVDCPSLAASFQNGQIRLQIPKEKMKTWALGREVSLFSEQFVGGEVPLKLLVEKDFQCINPSRVWEEDESDAYPNPNLTCSGAARHLQ